MVCEANTTSSSNPPQWGESKWFWHISTKNVDIGVMNKTKFDCYLMLATPAATQKHNQKTKSPLKRHALPNCQAINLHDERLPLIILLQTPLLSQILKHTTCHVVQEGWRRKGLAGWTLTIASHFAHASTSLSAYLSPRHQSQCP